MSLIGALNLSKSALAVQQAALQVTSNNIANAGNPDYTREVANLSTVGDQQISPGIFVGQGVKLDSITRQIDDALEGRIRSGVSDNEAAQTSAEWLGEIESTFHELGDDDLSTQLSTFFSAWSNLANKPQDMGLRQVVLADGQSLADSFTGLRGHLESLAKTMVSRLPGASRDADALAQQIADLNGQIVTAEGGTGGTANGLRDQRDAAIKKLTQLIDLKTVPQINGVVNVYVGSEPLVIGTDNRGVGIRTDADPTTGASTPVLVFRDSNGVINASGGQLGGLVNSQSSVDGVIKSVDGLASNLIFELNKIHASGQGLAGTTAVTATSVVADPTIALTDPRTGLAHVPSNGSFVVHVKDKGTGLTTSTLVQVDLNGAGTDTTLNSLTASLSAIDGISASINAGKLAITAQSSNVEISFSQDSSGTLAALGLNTFYTGKDARDIAVNQALVDQPSLLAAARNGDKGDNQTARAIAALESQPVAGLKGSSLKDSYQAMVNGVAVSAAGAKADADGAQAVVDTLSAQRDSLSGVSLDEEAVNLMRQQRAFQGSAKVITTINEMMDTVLNMVR